MHHLDNKKNYYMSSSWRLLMIIPGIGLFCILLIPFLPGMKMTGSINDVIGLITLFSFLWVLITAEALTGKIVTSPAGIEWHTFFMRFSASWKDAHHVETNPFGFLSLVFSQPHHPSKRSFSWLRQFSPYRKIQILPYIEDFHTSGLIKDIEFYAPVVKVMEEVKDRKSFQFHQKISSISLYLLFCFIISVPMGSFARNLAIYIENYWLNGAGFILIMGFYGWWSAVIAGGFQLLRYAVLQNYENKSEINRYALSLYWSPLIGTFLAMLSGILLYAAFSFFHYRVQNVSVGWQILPAFIAGLIAAGLYRKMNKKRGKSNKWEY
jgi:hypothetical protein